MVMRRTAMRKNLTQSILRSFGRYLAIVMIIALGASMFVGLLMTKADMIATGQKHLDDLNMFDLRLVSMYGWDKDHVDKIAAMDAVEDVKGLHMWICWRTSAAERRLPPTVFMRCPKD